MAAGKKRAANEIDDIFAAPKPKPAAAAASSTKAAAASAAPAPAPGTAGTATSAVTGNKRKKSKVAPAEEAAQGADHAPQPPAPPAKRVPETVVDTSKAIETYKPAPMLKKSLGENATEEERKAAEDDERFMDSRGTRASCLLPVHA